MGKAVVCALALGALLVAGPALSAPITYFYTSGSVDVTASTDPGGVSVLSTTNVPLDGVYVTFDDATFELTDFSLTIPTTGVINLDTAYGGFDQIVIESADISPGFGYSSIFDQDLGGGVYSFLVGPLDINGVYSAYDSTLTNLPVMNLAVPFTDTSLLSGTININTGELTLSGITLTTLLGSNFGETDDLVIKGDITFQGTVPEPSTAALLVLGLAGLACNRRRIFLK